jgi:hypothetical protein
MTEPSGGTGPASARPAGQRDREPASDEERADPSSWQRASGEYAGREQRGRAGGSQRGTDAPGKSWEQRTSGVASEIQRWLIRTSARNMRDELGGQVKKAFRGSEPNAGDSWATATTEPPHAADEAPECAWCPVCRAARRIAQSRSGSDSRGGPRLSDAADVVAGAVRDALAGLDSVLSYRPGAATPAPAAPAADSPPTPGAGPADAEPPAAGPAAAEPPDAGPAAAEPPAAERAGDPTERA